MLKNKQSTITMAKQIIKTHYGACILSAIEGPLDGCHIFSCSLFPSLSKYPCAVVPLIRRHHLNLDNYRNRTRSPKGRIEYLMIHCMPEYRSRFILQIEMLFELCEEKNLSMGKYISA